MKKLITHHLPWALPVFLMASVAMAQLGAGSDYGIGDTGISNAGGSFTGAVVFPAGSAASPSVAFGDADTGFFESVDDELHISTAGVDRYLFTSSVFGSNSTVHFGLFRSTASSTVPTVAPRRADSNTGIGWNADGELSLIGDGVEVVRVAEAAGEDVVTINAQIVHTGTDPTLSACGTSPSVTGGDSAGKVTIGTGATTSCTVTFATAMANAPACVVTGEDNAVTYAATSTTTALTITSSADMASDVVNYVCFGL